MGQDYFEPQASHKSSALTSAPRSVGDPHRAVTLRHQYRFLPALAHAKALEGWRSGAFQWLVLVDDDAMVYPERLARVLGSRPHPSTWLVEDVSGRLLMQKITLLVCWKCILPSPRKHTLAAGEC